MIDEEMLAAGHEVMRLRAQAKELEAQAKELTDDMLAELDRRDLDSIEQDGVKVLRIERRRYTYDLEALRTALRPGAFRRVTVLTVDQVALQREVKDGRIPAADVADCVTEEKVARYVQVTLKAAA